MTKRNFKSQEGVTLLLAVLIMSGIALITVTISFFVIQELKGARASILTEPAITAAETAGEQSVFEIKRGTFTTDCNSASYTQMNGVSGGTTNTRIKRCIAFTPAVFELISPSTPLEFYLYDPADVNGNLCMEASSCTGAQLFDAIVINHLIGSYNVNVNMVTLDGIPVANTTVSPGSTISIPIPLDISGSTDERLKIKLTPTGIPSTVQVSTTGLYNGLPDFRTVDAEGCVGVTNIANCNSNPEIFKRRLNITVPAPF